jgi:hypothetical protein
MIELQKVLPINDGMDFFKSPQTSLDSYGKILGPVEIYVYGVSVNVCKVRFMNGIYAPA